nr:hypothetical protein BaRGS_035041 [Batillaria attramentaria]
MDDFDAWLLKLLACGQDFSTDEDLMVGMGYLWDDIPDVDEGLLELLTILWHHMLLNIVVPVAHSVQAVVDEDKISVASGAIIEL